jgi:hypothetical protein
MDNVICICGTIHLECNTSRHLKYKNHIDYINNPMEIRIRKERVKRHITCECGSKYQFKKQIWRESHERSYKPCKFINKFLNE